MSLYTNLNNLFRSEDSYNFMNHGYSPSYKNLKGYHKTFKHQSSLYLKLVQDLEISNKSLLDIGCGRGGGVDLYSQTLNPSKIIGLDINPDNIEYCKKNVKNVEFIEGDAQNLPFKDNNFDFITNVESSNYYKDINLFFSEVKRVLKPGGMFLYASIFESYPNPNPKFTSSLIENLLPFSKIIKEDITKNVTNACKKDVLRWNTLLPNSKSKEYLLNLHSTKFLNYSLGGLKYIVYKCYN